MKKYFPTNYTESRERFLERSELIQNAELKHWKIPGTKDDDFYVDHLWLAPLVKSTNLLVFCKALDDLAFKFNFIASWLLLGYVPSHLIKNTTFRAVYKSI